MTTLTIGLLTLLGLQMFIIAFRAAWRLPAECPPSARACASASSASGILLALSVNLRPDLLAIGAASASMCTFWALSLRQWMSLGLPKRMPCPPTIAAALLAVILAWPPSWWLDLSKMHVDDVKAGQPIGIKIERTIERKTSASWLVMVHRVTSAGYESVCAANGLGLYKPGARLPEPLTLRWWTNNACDTLPPGRYVITTQWDLKQPIVRSLITRVSNEFEVTP